MSTITRTTGGSDYTTNLYVIGAGGSGTINLTPQSSTPATPLSSMIVYYDATNGISWMKSDGHSCSLSLTPSANRIFTLPDISDTIVTRTNADTLSNKTILSATNIIDATKLQTINISNTAPVNGQALIYNSTNTQWQPSVVGSSSAQRWTIKDIQSVGTNGGTFTSGAWQTRTLNTLGGSSDSSVTISNNQITFTTGTYCITAFVPAYRVGLHKAKLYNITLAADIAFGTSAECALSDNTTSISHILERVTFSTSTVVEIRHYCMQTENTDGFGIATGIPGTNEIYTTVIIEKLN